MDFAQLLIEGLFAIVLSGIGFFLRQIAAKLEKVADSIVDLRVEMVADFVRKDEWQELRKRLHDIEDRVAGLMAAHYLENERRKVPR